MNAPGQGGRAPLRRAAGLAGSVWVGVALIALLLAWLALASVVPATLARWLRTSPAAVYGHGLGLALWLLLCANLVVATLTRVPRRLRSAGAWCSHLGVIVLAGGALWYTCGAVRGRCAAIRTADGWTPIRYLYRDDTGAVYVGRAGEPARQVALGTLRWGAGGVQPLDVSLPGGEGAALRVRGFAPAVRLTAVAELRLRDGRADRRITLAPDDPGRQRFTGEGYSVIYVDDVWPEDLERLSAPGASSETPRREHDLAFVVTGWQIAPTLVIVRPDGARWRRALTVGQALDVPLAGRKVRLVPLRFYRRPITAGAAGPAGPAPTPALVVQAAVGDWQCTTHLPFASFAHLAWPQALHLPGGRTLQMSFSHARFDLGGEIRILSTEYLTWPASVVPKDYRCRLRVTHAGRQRAETLSLNRPVQVGPYQISQGSWLPSPERPMRIMLTAATRPGLPVIWTGCALIVVGMLFAFYVKPLLVARKGAGR